MTNINSGVLSAVQWPSRPGAFGLRASFPGTGVSGAGGGTGPCVPAARPAPRVRDKVTLTVSAMQLGQTNIHNSMTSVVAVGEGAVGPPPYREPA